MEKVEYSKPKFLSVVQIADIVSVIPDVKAATKEASDNATKQIKYKLSIQLRELRMCHEQIPQLKLDIYKQFLRSVITPGEAVGITASEGVGGPATQMTLSGFHQAGSSRNVGSGVDRLREMLNQSLNRKVETTIIHFKNKNMSLEDVLEYRRQIIGVTVSDLVKKHRIEASSRDTMDENGEITREIVPYHERGFWYNSYMFIFGDEFQDASHYLRLEIDKTRMFAFNLTLDDIVNTLEAEKSGMLKCIASPVSFDKLYIDIYPDQQQVMEEIKVRLDEKYKKSFPGIDSENASLVLLRLFVQPYLGSFLIKGIKGITSVFPQTIRTLSAVRSCVKKYRDIDLEEIYAHYPDLTQEKKDEYANMWTFWFDPIKLKINGIPMTKVVRLIEMCGLNIIERPNNLEEDFEVERRRITFTPQKRHSYEPIKITVTMPAGQEYVMEDGKRIDINPYDYISKLIDTEEQNATSTYQENKKKGIIKPVEISNLYREGIYTYADTNGYNLGPTLNHPLIDSRYTISNNPNDIYNTIGIQACYNFISRDLYEIITDNDAYVSPRHIMTLVSSMTNISPMPITSRGVSRQNRGTFADASFEHAVDAFIKACTFGKWEGVGSTSTCIFIGNTIKIGTGLCRLSLDVEALKKIIDAIALDKMTKSSENSSRPSLHLSTKKDEEMDLSILDELATNNAPTFQFTDEEIVTSEIGTLDVQPELGQARAQVVITKSVSFKGPIPKPPSYNVPLPAIVQI
jgi:hypothetical protein